MKEILSPSTNTDNYTSVDKSEKQFKRPKLNLPVVMSKIIAEDKNMTAKGILLPKKCKVIMQTM